jgi:hypothetical protein
LWPDGILAKETARRSGPQYQVLFLALITLLTALSWFLGLLTGLVLLTLLATLTGLVALLVLLTLIILVRHERFLSGVRSKILTGKQFFVPEREVMTIGSQLDVPMLDFASQRTAGAIIRYVAAFNRRR